MRKLILALCLLHPAIAWGKDLTVVGHNTNADCQFMDQDLAGKWSITRGLDERHLVINVTTDEYVLTKGVQHWLMPQVSPGLWRIEQHWNPYGIGAVIAVTYDEKRLVLTTNWGCRWSSE